MGITNNKIEELKKIREIYNEKIKLKKEKIKLLNTQSVKRYISIMGYKIPNIELDEDIMMNILKKFHISSNNIYIDYGIHVSYDEDSLYECSVLLREDEINCKVIQEQLQRHVIVKSDIENIFYSLESGRFRNFPYNSQIADNPIIIMLPSTKKKIENLGEYDGSNGCIHYQERLLDRLSNKNEILRSQYFIKLMNEEMQDVLDYYSNSNNLEEIEGNMCKYYKMKGNNK